MVSAQLVKELREKTGAGMMDCKKALTETNGDMEKAIEYLREKGLAAAAKKSGRIAAEGLVGSYISDDQKTGVLVEVNCETDFVAKNEEFQQLVKDIAFHITESNPENETSLLEQSFVKDSSVTVQHLINEKIAKIGENMSIRRFTRYSLDNGIVEAYIHGNGRIGVIVEISSETNNVAQNPEIQQFAKDIAMQIAAASPQFINRDEVPQDLLDKEREILLAQAINEGKPANIAEKMVAGRIEKFYKEICLLEQPFIKDPDTTVQKLLKEKISKIGENLTISRFTRYTLGEGIEKKEENFVEEVMKASQVK